MKKITMLLAVAALALAVPVFGHSTESNTDCVTAATLQPAVPAGSTVQNLGPVDANGYVWGKQYGGDPAGEVGIKGAHGWMKISGSALTQSGRIEGRQTESGFSGYVVIGTSPKVCASVGGQKIHQP